jgi:ethanolamine ammonia-lyase small subunit
VGERSRGADPLSGALRRAVSDVTPARVFLGGSATSYPTAAWLQLRADHAAARDALAARLDLDDPALADFVDRYHPIRLVTEVTSPAQYLVRPDLGRRLSEGSRRVLAEGPDRAVDIGLVLGDGLSAKAVVRHGPALVDALVGGAQRRGWTTGRPVVVEFCRVGVLNDLGPLLRAEVVVLLIGERPGLGVVDSLSAYLAYRPGPGCTDAERNLISGIHDRSTPVPVAARRVLDLIGALRDARCSGVAVKEPDQPVTVAELPSPDRALP